ncbi:MAG TPA: class I SAM-dependent methyltransferase [Vicinamibacterales bacterium]|nr:class I SAM-dependent methyltransferase [Vicinamibacterales bacterium]
MLRSAGAELEVRQVSAEWSDFAASASDEDLRERILTGFRSGKPFTPYVPTLPMPAAIGSVLDFGCGLGRNFPYLKTIASHVVGFDLPEMIERCRNASPVGVALLSADWNAVRAMRFDLVFASLVLQHVPEDVCRAALDDFATMAPMTYLLARGEGDFGFSALDLAARSARFEAGECRVVDHDPATHQLRVVGTVPFDEARSAGDSRHFEVLLHSRIYRR